jgi:hypothetical protein
MQARRCPTRTIALLAGLAWLGTGAACSDLGPPGSQSPADAALPGDGNVAVAAALAEVEGLTIVAEQALAGGFRRFRLAFEQPVDHASPDGPRFTQMLTLVHRDMAAPMVLASTGYHDFLGDALTEPAVLLGANQVVVEHRYFGASRPEPADWTYLDIEQAAADHHRVIEALRPIYGGPWISTGSSKGGMTSIFHRRFYPGDVVATVAYVAPINFSVDDTRYEAFFDQLDQSLADTDCVDRVRALQREALLRRDELGAYFAEAAVRSGYTFERTGGLARALEIGVVELEWTFWQYQGVAYCGGVPTPTDSTGTIAGFIEGLGVVWAVSDQEVAVFEPYYYQVLTELGYPSVPFAHLVDLMQFDYEAGLAPLLPAGVAATYDPAPMRDVSDWLSTQGEHLLLVYGAHDPWTAGAMTVDASLDSYVFVAPGTNHGARIDDLASEDNARALDALRAWTGQAGALAVERDTLAGQDAPDSAIDALGALRERAPVRTRLGL